MRRQLWMQGTLVAAILLISACGGSSSTGSAGQTGTKLSAPVPDYVKQKGKLVAGVKCDDPPYGSKDAQGNNVGVDVELVKHMAKYAFGSENAVQFVCDTSADRIPSLTSKRVDIVAATLGITPERATQIDFSNPYYASLPVFIVVKGVTFQTISELNRKTITSVNGSAWNDWLRKCYPGVNVLLFNTTSEALLSVTSGRSIGYLEDDTTVLDLVQKVPNTAVTGPQLKQLGLAWGFGIRKGETQMGAWVNAAIAQMQQEDFFWTNLVKFNPDPSVQAVIKDSVPRPGSTPDYKAYVLSYASQPPCA